MKSIFESRTLWVNAITLALQYANLLPISPAALVYVLGALNLALRLLTDQGVRIPLLSK